MQSNKLNLGATMARMTDGTVYHRR